MCVWQVETSRVYYLHSSSDYSEIMILARNSFLRPPGTLRHGGSLQAGPTERHQPHQGAAALLPCPGHVSKEVREVQRVLQELLLLGSEGTTYKNNRIKNLPAPQIVISSHTEAALSGRRSCRSAWDHCQSCSLGTRTFKHVQPGRKRQQPRLHTQNRAGTRGISADFWHQTPGLPRPSERRGASPGAPVCAVSATERVSHSCKEPLFGWLWRGHRDYNHPAQ